MVKFKQQKGIVLVVSLVFLIALTAVASVIMLNTSTDVKIAGASEERLIALQDTISAVDETVGDQITSGTNLFTKQKYAVTGLAITTVTSVTVDSIKIFNVNTNNVLADCPHSRLASSNKLLKCNVLRVEVKNKYGRSDTSEIEANASIAQQLLNVGN